MVSQSCWLCGDFKQHTPLCLHAHLLHFIEMLLRGAAFWHLLLPAATVCLLVWVMPGLRLHLQC